MAGHEQFRTIQFLNYKNLEEIPDEVLNDPRICVLYAKRNLLKTLPRRIGQLTNLVEINLDSNKIDSLLPDLNQLDHLEILDLKQNKLSMIPECIFDLKKLRNLNLYNNQISAIGKGIRRMQSLECLVLTYNHLCNLPNELFECAMLKELDVDSNYLKYIPNQIVKLKNLVTLSLNKNKISFLPLNINLAEKLLIVGLYENPVVLDWLNSVCLKKYNGKCKCCLKSNKHISIEYNETAMEDFEVTTKNIKYYYGITVEFGEKVETLRELSSRVLYKTFCGNVKNKPKKQHIPNWIINIIDCPNATCLLCSSFVFTWAVLKRYDDNDEDDQLNGNSDKNVYAVFCSVNCKKRFDSIGLR